MSKILIISGSILGVLFVAGVILSIVAPKQIEVTSKQFVHAPVEEVFDQVRFMKNYPRWSPFRETDPQQKFSVTGIDGEKGATFHWEGVAEKSKGSQTVSHIVPNRKIVIDCTITLPFESQPTFTYTFQPKDGGVEVTQVFEAKMPVPVNVIAMLTGLKNNIAALNKKGLVRLSEVSQSQLVINK